MSRIRVLVVDDSAVFRRAIADALTSDPDIEIAGTAPNGKIALAKISQINPDVVTLDIEMPEMDGLTTLREIRKKWPLLPVLMFSTHTEPAAAATVEALLAGATDYATKPTSGEGVAAVRGELIPKVKATIRRAGSVSSAAPAPVAAVVAPRLPAENRGPPPVPKIVAIGVSTGGPNALATVFTALRGGLPVPLVVVQHMPPMFTRILSERLAAVSGMAVREAAEGDVLEAGSAFVAPGGSHMTVVRDGTQVRVRLNQDPPENCCRPSVDVLFRSVAEAYGSKGLAVVMTGMGQDGLRGSERIREAGGYVWAQDEATSVVWGMPGYVVRANLAERILPLKELGAELIQRVSDAPGLLRALRGSR